MSNTRDTARRYIGDGFAVVPIPTGTKGPTIPRWQQTTFTADDFGGDDNIGIRLGEPSGGLVDIDCDSLMAGRVARQIFTSGLIYGRASKPSSHYLVNVTGVVRLEQFKNPFTGAMIVELRSTGQQSVLPGSIHPSGERVEWARQEPALTFSPEEIRRVVADLAFAAFIAEMWAAGNRHAFALALAGYGAKRGLPIDRTRQLIRYVVHATNDDDPADRDRCVTDTYRDFENGHDISANFNALVEQPAIFLKTIDSWMGTAKRRFRIHDESTLLSRPPARFLANGLLVEGALTALVSNPGVGKTFLALDLALAIAAGEPTWLGRSLHGCGPVLYVIGEGLGRFQYRVLAWKQTHGVTRTLPFYWIDEPVPLLDEHSADAFIKEVAPVKPGLVVLDTLSRCLMGGNENSQEDMGRAIAVCDNLRARTGASVLLLHHMKKDGTVERGSTVLRGAADTLLTLKEEARGVLTLSCEKQKDADAFEPMTLARTGIQLDGVVEPETGEPASSCVIRIATDADRERAGRTRQSRALEYVRSHPGLTRDDLCEALGGRRADLRREIDELVSVGEIREQKDGKRKRLFVEDAPKLEL